MKITKIPAVRARARCKHTGLSKPECSCPSCVAELVTQHVTQGKLPAFENARAS